MGVFGKVLEFLGKSITKELDKNASKEASKEVGKNTHKQIHKEQRGIYNVTYNNKIATYIKTDLDSIENAIRYAQGNKNKGAKHIRLGHTLDEKQEGYITQQELLNLGKKYPRISSQEQRAFYR